MRNAGLDEAQAGIKITGRNINNLRYADDEEGNGNPLQCSCLENPRDGQARRAAVLWGRTESDMTEATQQQQQHADDTTLMAESEEELNTEPR